MGKVIVLNEATGWTIYVENSAGETVDQAYVSLRNWASPAKPAKDFAAHYGRPEPLPIEYRGNSRDYDREIRAIANDPHFMT